MLGSYNDYHCYKQVHKFLLLLDHKLLQFSHNTEVTYFNHFCYFMKGCYSNWYSKECIA